MSADPRIVQPDDTANPDKHIRWDEKTGRWQQKDPSHGQVEAQAAGMETSAQMILDRGTYD